jgi:transcriptional regulator with XRE-family HTH domain
VATKARQVDVGTARGMELIRRAGQENREARMDRGLSLSAVGRAVGLSESQVSRIERGLVEHVSVCDLARLHAVVGLELSLKSYPFGQPIRDLAHIELLDDLRMQIHRSLRWAVEVPLPIPGDKRSWDAFISAAAWRYGVEAETAPRDSQSVARRIQLKQRDGQVDGVLLLLRRTVQTRRFLAEAGGHLRDLFPVDGPRALELLRAGVDPGGNAIIVLPLRVRGSRGSTARLAAGARTTRSSAPQASP